MLLRALITSLLLLLPGAAYAIATDDIPVYSDTTGGKVKSNGVWKISPTTGTMSGTIGVNNKVLDLTTSFPTVFGGGGPFEHFNLNVGGFPDAGRIPADVPHVISAKLKVPSTYTQQPWPPCVVCAFGDNLNATSGNSLVGLFTATSAGADGANFYGGNFGIGNSTPFLSPVNGSGFNFNIGVGLEIDANIMKRGGSAPTGILYGIYMIGASEASPVSGSVAVEIEQLGPSVPWGTGIHTTAGAVSNFAVIGQNTTGASQASQPIIFKGNNAASVEKSASIKADLNGSIILTPATPTVAGGGVVQIDGVIFSNGTAPAVSSCGTSPAVTSGSTSVRGAVTPGTGSPTSCTLTFNSGDYTVAPFCVVSTSDVTKPVSITGTTAALINIGITAGLTTRINYMCME